MSYLYFWWTSTRGVQLVLMPFNDWWLDGSTDETNTGDHGRYH